MEYDNQSAILARLKNLCRNYFHQVMDISIRSVLLLIGTAVINLIVLYFYSILWHIFCVTYSGKKFTLSHPVAAGMISEIVNNDLIEISIHSTFSAFTICLLICAICQLIYITRFIYYPQSVIVRLLFWGLPLTAVVSLYTNDQIQMAHWAYTIPVTIVPTLCVFSHCFKFAEALLPEFGEIIIKIFQWLKTIFSMMSPKER